jgi:lipopolysaccharide/colanic/teichoic acid biosynthesis glycosyltransferase
MAPPEGLVILLIAALVRIFIGGPVLVAQHRIGYGGRTFVCYKFRTGRWTDDRALADECAIGGILRWLSPA